MFSVSLCLYDIHINWRNSCNFVTCFTYLTTSSSTLIIKCLFKISLKIYKILGSSLQHKLVQPMKLPFVFKCFQNGTAFLCKKCLPSDDSDIVICHRSLDILCSAEQWSV